MKTAESDFARVYEKHVWQVYGFFAYRVRDRDLAEDLTQTAFEHALRAWSRFDPTRASELTWLLAISRNLLIDDRRRDRGDHAALDEELLSALPAADEAATTSLELAVALDQLGDREREVIALRFGGDLKGPEIADMLGLSVANVQQIASRALRKLRGALGDLHAGSGASDGEPPVAGSSDAGASPTDRSANQRR